MRPRTWLLTLFFLTLACRAVAGLTPAFTPDDVDLAACRAFVDGEEASRPSAAAVAAALCGAPSGERWSTGPTPGLARHFVVGFKKPVMIGTVCAPEYRGTVRMPLRAPDGSFVSILKPAAAYPGDPSNEDHWTLLRPGAVKYLTPAAQTRAIRFS